MIPGFPGERFTRNAAERDQFRNDLAAVIESPEGFSRAEKDNRRLRRGQLYPVLRRRFRRSLQRGRKTLREMTKQNPPPQSA